MLHRDWRYDGRGLSPALRGAGQGPTHAYTWEPVPAFAFHVTVCAKWCYGNFKNSRSRPRADRQGEPVNLNKKRLPRRLDGG